MQKAIIRIVGLMFFLSTISFNSELEIEDDPNLPPVSSSVATNVLNNFTIDTDKFNAANYVPPKIGFIASHTSCGKCNQYLFQCLLESCFPWMRISNWGIGLGGLIASGVSVSLIALSASGLITTDDPTVLWVAFGAGIVAGGAKALLLFNSELLKAMQEDAEKNYQAMVQNTSGLQIFLEDAYAKIISGKQKKLQDPDLDPEIKQQKAVEIQKLKRVHQQTIQAFSRISQGIPPKKLSPGDIV